MDSPVMVAAAIDADIKSSSPRNTQALRALRKRYSRELEKATPVLMFRLARLLCKPDEYRWFAYELIQGYKGAFAGLGASELEALGRGNHSWWTVDSFAQTLSGPAWLNGQVSDALIVKWASSCDRWWRRAALVTTVALNVRSQGGRGDVPKTLKVCRILAGDHDEMVAKALSWALRALVVHDPVAVRGFLNEYDGVLGARVKREVMNKLGTGLKNPKLAS